MFDEATFADKRDFNTQERESLKEVIQLVREIDDSGITGAYLNNGIRNGAATNNDREGSLWVWTDANIFEFPQFPNISEWDVVPNKFFRLRVLQDGDWLRAIATVSMGLVCDFRAVGDSRQDLREIIAGIVKRLS